MRSATIKRVYDKPADTDGTRILVDRLWPRGLSKAKAALDGWDKDVAPSAALRKWFGHKPERFAEFRKRHQGQADSVVWREGSADQSRHRSGRGTAAALKLG